MGSSQTKHQKLILQSRIASKNYQEKSNNGCGMSKKLQTSDRCKNSQSIQQSGKLSAEKLFGRDLSWTGYGPERINQKLF